MIGDQGLIRGLADSAALSCSLEAADCFPRNFIIIDTYLIFVIFFTRAKFLENKIYTEKMRKLRQNTQKVANFLRYYGKIHRKLPIFCVKSVKIYTGQKTIYTNIFVAFVTNMRYGLEMK